MRVCVWESKSRVEKSRGDDCLLASCAELASASPPCMQHAPTRADASKLLLTRLALAKQTPVVLSSLVSAPSSTLHHQRDLGAEV